MKINYEQKYKEALERAIKIEKGEPINVPNGTSIPVAIFPELKDSEDEKIRKQIVSFLKEFEHDHYRSLDFSSWIDWLEKQGEQKSVDKVESKFHEGDFIKHNRANIICKVILVNSVYYDVENIETRAESELFYAEENFHLWTIKDAKDGDVLRLGDVIAIFKKYIGQEKCICYCSFCDNCYCSSCNNVGFEIPIENGEDNVYGCTNTTPATKEERDLLFQKMKEDGYEWNADEKVLNKVIIYEQK